MKLIYNYDIFVIKKILGGNTLKSRLSNLNYSKLNPYMFLISVAVSMSASFVTSLVSDISFAPLFFICIVISAVLFYRLNNGLIALIFGDFGKTISKKHKYFFKHLLTQSQTEELKKSVCYGEKSLIVRRKGTESYFQIIKRDNSFFIKKCSSVKLNTVVKDFTSSRVYKGKKNTELKFNDIKELGYTIDTDDEMVIFISEGKQKFYLVPEFPIEKETLEEFLSNEYFSAGDIFKETPLLEFEKVNKTQKTKFINNVISMFSSICMVQCFAAILPQKSVWLGICILIFIISMWAMAILSFIQPEKFFYYDMFFEKHSTRSGYEIKQVFILIIPLLPIVLGVSIIDLVLLLKIAAAVFVITFAVFFPKLISKKRKNTKSSNTHIITACVMLAVTCFMSVYFVNNLYLKSEETKMYITDGYYSNRSSYYTYIIVDDKELSVNVSEEEYNSNAPQVEATRLKGLLDIEYIV